MATDAPDEKQRPCVVLLDGDVVARHVLAEYLRECGYQVVEAATSEELIAVLEYGTPAVDTVLFDLEAPGAPRGFALRNHLRDTYPHIDIIPAGSTAVAAREAEDLCEEGPQLQRPYHSQLVLARIRRMKGRAGLKGAEVKRTTETAAYFSA
ncbi:response regulator transcription factor [Aquabacter cavernae]|uniref:response regulator transcription factor n=1 Tax=Aquabacter cavernae TaxID=2496029 RepID=UPI000F8DAEE7|nr:response regulator transcription factor [Aquabacter cavernae]